MRRLIASMLVGIVVVAACSSSGSSTSGSTSASAPANPLSGSLTVFAAASLTESFGDLESSLEAADAGLSLTFSFAGSGALVAQVESGAPADVIATADRASMQQLVDAGLVEAPQTFARNQLEILVQPGNPKGIKAITDLARADITFVTEDDTVPAGKYAAQVLQAAGVTVHPVSKEADVKSAVQKVASGEADATVVYATDVEAAGSKGTGVEIPAAQNVIATYPIAVVKATAHHAAAAAFVAAVLGDGGRAALARRGFLAPA